MQTIDSTTKKLPLPELVMVAAEQFDLGDTPIEAATLALVKEMNMPRADVTQVGNTIYVAHFGKGVSKHKIFLRAINLDTGRNFVKNSMKYIQYLQKKKVTHVSLEFEGDVYLSFFKMLQKWALGTDSQVGIALTDRGSHRVFVRLGKRPLVAG